MATLDWSIEKKLLWAFNWNDRCYTLIALTEVAKLSNMFFYRLKREEILGDLQFLILCEPFLNVVILLLLWVLV